jgi:hypothetical protein
MMMQNFQLQNAQIVAAFQRAQGETEDNAGGGDHREDENDSQAEVAYSTETTIIAKCRLAGAVLIWIALDIVGVL